MQAHEIERMRRQVLDQQKRERQLEYHQDGSQRQLKETGTKLKWQAASIRGGYNYNEYRRPRATGKTMKVSKKESAESSPYKLPAITNTKNKCRKKVRYVSIIYSLYNS